MLHCHTFLTPERYSVKDHMFASRSSRFYPNTVFIGALLLGQLLKGQTFTGNISGRVTDPAGLAIPDVQVVVTQSQTNETSRTVTNRAGNYSVAFLKPGAYKVSFNAKGFKEFVQNGLELQLNQSFRLDQALQVGSVTESVEVNATQSEVNFDSPEGASVVGAEQLANIPEVVNPGRGRSPFLLAKLLPGVVSTSSNNSNINNFSFGGGRPDTNELLVDGLPTTNPSDNTYTFTPSPDSIDEFKIITFAFSAEFGHTGGGVLLATSKQGANEFHGSLYEYFGNRILNARSFFQAANNRRYIVNDPGFTFGGPIVKNKTFFFADLNYTDNANPNSNLLLTPTAAERAGDFSQTNGGSVIIYDPKFTTTDANGDIIRTQFSGNMIPTNRIDPVAAKIVSYFPTPNGSFQSGAYNYQVNASSYNQTLQGLVRVDHNISDNDKIFARYGRYNPNSPAVIVFNNAANPNNTSGWYDNQAGLGWTHIFSPTVYNDFRAGFVQEINYTFAGGPAVPQLGLQGVSLSAFPDIEMSNYESLGASAPFHDRDRSYVFNEVLQLQRGRHTLKIGGDYRRQMYNYYNPGSQSGGSVSGAYNFDSTFTSITANPNSGWDLADLLLGLPTSTQIDVEDYTYRENINSASLFFQDDFKVRKNLTLNLGLRWEYDGPYSEANNQFASFNPNILNATTGNLGDVQFAGVNGAPSHFMPNIYHDFLPRAGFAWNAAKDTVIRGGFGVFRLPNIGFYQFGPLSKYVQQADFESLDGGVTAPFQLDQGVPAVPFYVDANGNPEVPASLTNPTSSVSQIDSRTRTPYNLSWQFGVQRQFGSWFADVEYQGSKGVKLPIVLQNDQVPVSEFAIGGQALRPYPQYAGISYLTMDGNSIYHALQAKLEHRWKNGLVVQSSYTFSKLEDDVDEVADSSSRAHHQGVQNVYDLAAEWGIGGYDIPQRFVTNFVYSLPFGPGKKFVADTPIVKDIVGGWELSGIAEYQIGQPLPITQSNRNASTEFTEAQRPNANGLPIFSGSQTLAHWFNTANFSVAPEGTLGTSARFPLHGPGLENWDLALQRNFILHERFKLQFRGQFFNAWNHANFGNPNGNVTSPSFGAISSAQAGRVTEVVLRLFF
jgi:outer membrane receptor protein involved in Fe transport